MTGSWKPTRWTVLLALSALLLACNGAGATSGSAPPPVQTETKQPARPRPQGSPQPELPKGVVEFERAAPRAPLSVQVEVASTDEQRQMGRMFREELGEFEGMLFIFPDERHNSFWMRNTLLPLDMFFIDSKWTVVGVVENAEPLTESPRQVDGRSQYVLEVNAGFAKRHGFGAGAKLRFVAPGESQ